MSDQSLVLLKFMQTTFALQRKEAFSNDLPAGEVLECWSAFKIESQVKTVSFCIPIWEDVTISK